MCHVFEVTSKTLASFSILCIYDYSVFENFVLAQMIDTFDVTSSIVQNLPFQ